MCNILKCMDYNNLDKMTPFVFAGTAIQQRLTTSLSTGDPIFDGLVSSIVVFVIALCTSYSHVIGKNFRYITETYLLGQRNTYTLTIVREEKHPKYNFSIIRNIDFDALIWFLTHHSRGFRTNHAKISCFHTQMSQTTDENNCNLYKTVDSFTPAVNHPIYLEVDNCYFSCHEKTNDSKTIKLILRENRREPKDSDQEIVYNVRIEISIHCVCKLGLDKLRSFVTRVRCEYLEYLTCKEWKQQLFKLKRPIPTSSSSQEKKLRWNGHPTHSSKTFDKIVLNESLKNELVEDLEIFLTSEEWYKDMGVSFKRGYMFCGPPGTGKTSAVMAIAGRAKYDIYSMDLSKILNDEELDETFEMLPEKCVVMMEDVDCMTDAVKKRQEVTNDEGNNNDNNNNNNAVLASLIHQQIKLSSDVYNDNAKACKRQQQPRLTLSALLNNIDGASNNHGRIFIMTSNHPNMLDPALLRFGRVDMFVQLRFCSHEQIHKFFQLYYPKHNKDELLTYAQELCMYPPETFSPAEISSTMQHFKARPQDATKHIIGRRTFGS